MFRAFFLLSLICVEQNKQTYILLQLLLFITPLPLPPSPSLAHNHFRRTVHSSKLHTSFSRAVRPLVAVVVLGVDLAAEKAEDHAEGGDFEKGRRIEAREQS